MEPIIRVCYVARLQRAVSGGGFPGVAPAAQPQAGMKLAAWLAGHMHDSSPPKKRSFLH
jgi:hypothetical protein